MAIIIRLNDHSQTRDMYPNVKGFFSDENLCFGSHRIDCKNYNRLKNKLHQYFVGNY